ncbi:BamA/TamA family outer membrane protein [Chitinophaga horti]|uniref:BamA/TamA family outer membrane protein n=1 Tax=Chitinophaga horti TaxID=2920382 RepID=A0ABY6J282_9BACT|nr:BamA/TamA family outer membrane protein [Chitinophaga horti]UYQ92471.1 BamA/TamA family outer membrane protein [Chitinophaga horti]
MYKYLHILLLCLYTAAVLPCKAQAVQPMQVVSDEGYIVIRHIIITGNKKTRTSVILRELGTVPGDTIKLKELSATLETRRKQLLNTSLFLNVTSNVKNWTGNEADIEFEVWERWYTFAFPIFKLADRNFNQWLVEQKGSIDRVNLGVKVLKDNLTGRNDEIKADIQAGYTQRVVLSYDLPYVDKRYRHGIGFSFSYSRNREVNDSTALNKQHFYTRDEFLRRNFSAGVSYTYRRAINTRHQAFLTYNDDSVHDSVAIRNPQYYGGGRTRARYLNLLYRVSYVKADSWQFPLKGVSVQAELEKTGIAPLDDINNVRIRFRGARYWQLAPKTFGALGIRAQAKLSDEQPYVAQKAMGYGDDYLRGYEYYVVDGTSFAIFKSTLRQQLLNTSFRVPLVPRKFSQVPLRIFAKTYVDAGYTYSKYPGDGFLNNRMLYSGGVGLEIVSFYDTAIRFEYSLNQLGEKGLFLHAKLDM